MINKKKVSNGENEETKKTVTLTKEQFANYGAFAVMKVCKHNKLFECLVSKVGIEVAGIITCMLFNDDEKTKRYNDELKEFIAERAKRDEIKNIVDNLFGGLENIIKKKTEEAKKNGK